MDNLIWMAWKLKTLILVIQLTLYLLSPIETTKYLCNSQDVSEDNNWSW